MRASEKFTMQTHQIMATAHAQMAELAEAMSADHVVPAVVPTWNPDDGAPTSGPAVDYLDDVAKCLHDLLALVEAAKVTIRLSAAELAFEPRGAQS